LIGDEMGVGKTIQALGIAYIYKQDWPLLIITPASLKFIWRDEILKWLPDFVCSEDIQLFKNGKEEFDESRKVFILSYDLATKRGPDIKKFQFKMCIADEVHYLKSRETKRTKALLPLL
jgi:SWI/SNF-related matrix-associated actin-dependent regulator 1 of chromatin subfamily A